MGRRGGGGGGICYHMKCRRKITFNLNKIKTNNNNKNLGGGGELRLRGKKQFGDVPPPLFQVKTPYNFHYSIFTWFGTILRVWDRVMVQWDTSPNLLTVCPITILIFFRPWLHDQCTNYAQNLGDLESEQWWKEGCHQYAPLVQWW